MRRRKSTVLAAVALGMLITATAFAQPGNRRSGRRGGSGNFGPKVGSKLPDLTVFDGAGKPLQLSSLKGSHTVLVFGCLT